MSGKQSKIDRQLTELEDKLTKHFDLRLINQVQQIRALAIAAGVKPKAFIEAFLDDKAQDQYFIDIHAEEFRQNYVKGNKSPFVKPDEKTTENQAENVS